MSLRAIVMAGGEGTRLLPMTENLPKPLVPLPEEPVMGYTLTLPRRHGIRDIGLCTLPMAARPAASSVTR